MTSDFNDSNIQTQVEFEGDSQEFLEPSEQQNINFSSSPLIEDSPVEEVENTSGSPVSQDSEQFRVDDNLRRVVMEQLGRPIDGDFIDKDQKKDIEVKLDKPLMTSPQFVVDHKIKSLVQKSIGKKIDDNFVHKYDKDKIEDQFGIVLPLGLDNPKVSSLFLAEDAKKSLLQRQISKAEKLLSVKVAKDQEIKIFKKIIKPLKNMPNNIEMVGEITVEPLPFDLTRNASTEVIESSLKINFSRQWQEKMKTLLPDLKLEDIQLYGGCEEGSDNKKLILACRNTIATSLSNTVITHSDKPQFIKGFRTAVYTELASISTTKHFAGIITPPRTGWARSASTPLKFSEQFLARKNILKKNFQQINLVQKLSNLKRHGRAPTQAYTHDANSNSEAIGKYILESRISPGDITLKKIRKRVQLLDANKRTQLFDSSAAMFTTIAQAEADLNPANLKPQVGKEALIKSAENYFKIKFIFTSSERIGFSNKNQILNLLVKISKMEKTKNFQYWPNGESTNRRDNKEKRETYKSTSSRLKDSISADLDLNDSISDDLNLNDSKSSGMTSPELSNGFPSIMLGYSNFIMFSKTTEFFTIKGKGMDNLTKDLKQASESFKEQAGNDGLTTSQISEIILKVKQHIGRFKIIKTNIDHFFEEYWRGGFS